MHHILGSFLLLCLMPILASAQTNHWEAAVLAEEDWRYLPGNSEPPVNWMQSDFNDASWEIGPGGFGYGDGDDNTIIPPTISLYIRKDFTITDSALIAAVSLYADYDDAFVAYLNGQEIARSNIGTAGIPPAYNATSFTDHEAQLYQGGVPEEFQLSLQQLDGIWNNGVNTLAIQIHNVGITSSDMSALFFLLFGISDTSSDYQPVPTWFSDTIFSSNLPLLLIDTDGIEIPNEPKIDAHLGIIDNGPGSLNFLTDPLTDYDGLIGIEIRGSSSQSFPKKSYGIETRLENGENNNVPLLGMPAENDWVLYGPYSDKSLMRNVLSFHIGRSMNRYATRTRWCELFINGEYRGLYVLMEKIKRDDNRVDIAELQPEDIFGDEVTGGYIFCIDRDDEGPGRGWYSPFTDAVFYKYHDPDHDELSPEQKTYIQNYITAFEADMDGFPSSGIYDQYIDVPSWIDYWIATEVFKHIDNFKLSFYMYKKKDSNGGKIHFGPLWDLNLGYGNFDFAKDPGPYGWSYEWANLGFLRPFWVLDLSEDPDIQNRTKCRWEELREGPLHTDSLLHFIDSTAMVLEDAQTRNFNRWPVLGTYVWPNNFIGATYEEELDFLKDWLTDRLNWLDANMPGDCSLVATEEVQKPLASLRAFPNPADDYVIFQLNGNSPVQGQLTLFDALGKIVLKKEIATGSAVECRLEHLPRGIYFYQFLAKDQPVLTGKLIRGLTD